MAQYAESGGALCGLGSAGCLISCKELGEVFGPNGNTMLTFRTVRNLLGKCTPCVSGRQLDATLLTRVGQLIVKDA